MLYSNSKRVDAERIYSEIISLKGRVLGYQESIKSLQSSLKSVVNAKNRQEEAYRASLTEKDAIIKELTNRICYGLSRIGYTPDSAVCDIADNAVVAGAKNGYIEFQKINENASDRRSNNEKNILL